MCYLRTLLPKDVIFWLQRLKTFYEIKVRLIQTKCSSRPESSSWLNKVDLTPYWCIRSKLSTLCQFSINIGACLDWSKFGNILIKWTQILKTNWKARASKGLLWGSKDVTVQHTAKKLTKKVKTDNS